MLQRLAGEGCRLAVCTNKLEWLSLRLLDTLMKLAQNWLRSPIQIHSLRVPCITGSAAHVPSRDNWTGFYIGLNAGGVIGPTTASVSGGGGSADVVIRQMLLGTTKQTAVLLSLRIAGRITTEAAPRLPCPVRRRNE